MKRLYASLPNGEVDPEWDVINTWQLVLCALKNAKCHIDTKPIADHPRLGDVIRYVEDELSALVEHNPFEEI